MYIFILAILFGWLENRNPSYPYITGDTFRASCDFVFDETNCKLNLKKCRYGSTFFVKNDNVGEFFRRIHSHIPFPYVLVCHNGDVGSPGLCASYLDDPKILAWYAMDPDASHPKLHPLPIGVANRHYNDQGDVELLGRVQNTTFEKSHLLYMCFAIGTYPQERQKVFDHFKQQPYCFTPTGGRPRDQFLADIAASKFVLSPRGNGLDCYRTWEALYLGAIPVVRTSRIDSLFKDLPVVIVNDWNEIDESFLNKKWAEHLLKQYKMETLYIDYWLDQINQYKRR